MSIVDLVSVDQWANSRPKELFYELKPYLGEPLHFSNKPGGYIVWQCRPSSVFEQHVLKDEILFHCFPRLHQDCITSTLKFYIPTSELSKLFSFTGAISYDTLKKELSVRCEDLKSNIITAFICMLLVQKVVSYKELEKQALFPCLMKNKQYIDANKMLSQMYLLQKANLRKHSKLISYQCSDVELERLKKKIQCSDAIQLQYLKMASETLKKLKKIDDSSSK